MGQFGKYINQRFPTLAMHLINRPSAKRRYKNSLEKSVVNGDSLTPMSDEASLVFFSLHKAGSAIGTQLLSKLHDDIGLKHINYDGYFSSCYPEGKELYKDEAFLNRAYQNKGFFYGAHRNYIPIPKLDKYKVLLQIRDPRDLLVSHYHGTIFINKIHQKKGVHAKRRALRLGLDGHVLDLAPRFKAVYQNYMQHLDMNQIGLLKFEDMVLNPDVWLSQISSYTALTYSESRLSFCQSRLNQKTDGSSTSHHRKAKPGEFTQILKPETIDALNKEFEDVLKFFSYAI